MTQVTLTRDNVVLVARLSAATRLCSGGFQSRIAILRCFFQVSIGAAIEPRAVVTTDALAARLSVHFDGLKRTPAHPLTVLAMNLGRWKQHRAPLMCAATAHEPTTLRLPTAELVAIDNYRCDIRQASGAYISRSAILRASIDSFARAFQI